MKKNKFWKVTEKNYETVYDRAMRTLHHMADNCSGLTTTYFSYVEKLCFVITEKKNGKEPRKYVFESDEFQAFGTNAFIRLKFEDATTYITIDIKQSVRVRILSDRIIIKMANTTFTISVERLLQADWICKSIERDKEWIINNEHLTEVPLSELGLPDSNELYDDILMNIGIDVDDEDYEYPSIKALYNMQHQQQEPDKDSLIDRLFEEPTNDVLDADTGVPIEFIDHTEFEQESEDVPFETMLTKAGVPNKNMSIIPASKAEEVFTTEYGDAGRKVILTTDGDGFTSSVILSKSFEDELKTKEPCKDDDKCNSDVVLDVFESEVEDKNLKVMYSTDEDIPDTTVVSQSFVEKLTSKEARMVDGKVEIRDIELEPGDKISGRHGKKE